MTEHPWQAPANRIDNGSTAQKPRNAVIQGKTSTPIKQTVSPLKPLTSKQQEFVRQLVNNPKASATQAVKQAYGKPGKPVTELSARNIASTNLTKPNIKHALSQYQTTAEYNLIKLANSSTEYALEGGRDGASYASVSNSVNNSILDRLLGKATSRVEQTSTSVTINVDLTGVTTEVTP